MELLLGRAEIGVDGIEVDLAFEGRRLRGVSAKKSNSETRRFPPAAP